MSTNFPSSLDTSTTIPVESAGTALSTNHVTAHQNIQDALEAIEAKVGIDGSAVTTSHDYKLSGVTGSDKAVSLTGTEAMTNKTLTSPTINTPKIAVGSDAVGDLHYTSNIDGTQARLGVGTDGKILKLVSGLPSWETETSTVDASTTVKGLVEAATAAEITAGTATGGTGAVLAVTPDALASSIYNDTAFFGDGSDGDVTISVNTSLSRDMYYDDLTINTGVVLTTAGYRIFANSVTINGTGSIDYSGNAGGNGSNGTIASIYSVGGAGGSGGTAGSALSAGSIAGGVAGVAGATGGAGGASGNPGSVGGTGTTGNNSTISIGVAGNNGATGGAGGAGAGGIAGGAGSAGTGGSVSSTPKLKPRIAQWAVQLYDIDNTTLTRMNSSAGSASGAGGGGGGGSSGGSGGMAGSGGGGGGGSGSTGGIIMISSKTITIGASAGIYAKGGAGGNGGNGADGTSAGGNQDGAGGGGAGGNGGTGGVIVLVYRTLTNSGTISVAGGAGGTKGTGGLIGSGYAAGSDGNNGNTGSTGSIYQIVV